MNNTFAGGDNTKDALHLNGTKVNIYNNIFAHHHQRVIENIGGSSTITASNNCYIDYGIMLPANSGDVRSTDALFVNESARDYRLQANSPCLGMGAEFSGGGSAKPGDINGDGAVNLFDYNLIVSQFGRPYTLFDFNDVITHYDR